MSLLYDFRFSQDNFTCLKSDRHLGLRALFFLKRAAHLPELKREFLKQVELLVQELIFVFFTCLKINFMIKPEIRIIMRTC